MAEADSPEEIAREFGTIAALGDQPDEAAKIRRALAWTKRMAGLQGLAYDRMLFDLLRTTEEPFLRGILRSLLAQRRGAESFLAESARSEKDPEMQAEALQALGGIRSPLAAPLARQAVACRDERCREVALWVLGWVGDADDIPVVEERMLAEGNPRLRIGAASALRQLAWSRPESKPAALLSLKRAFEHEKSDEVLRWIIVMIGTVAVKNLGLREDEEHTDLLHGDLERAKKRAAEFVKTL